MSARWTAAEDQYLRENADCSPRLLARDLARSEPAVMFRRCHLGVTRKASNCATNTNVRPVTEEEWPELARDLYAAMEKALR